MVSWKTSDRRALGLVASLLMTCSAGVLCQQTSQKPDTASPPASSRSQSQAQPDRNPPKKNQPSGDNAFPMSQSEAAAKAASKRALQQNHETNPQTTPAPLDNPSTQKSDSRGPDEKGSSQSKPSPAQDNPFPEAQSKAAAKADSGAENPAGSQTGTSSSATGYSSSSANLPLSDLGQGKPGSHPKMDTYTRDHTQDGRIEDDLKVADLYMKTGNYRGALLRYQDTLQYDPQNDTALYGVAEAMCRQNLTDEAMAHFKSYAKNNPQGKYAIKAEKMLAHPNKCMHNW
jgi:tetratricopeptide (TPR) repeat protein